MKERKKERKKENRTSTGPKLRFCVLRDHALGWTRHPRQQISNYNHKLQLQELSSNYGMIVTVSDCFHQPDKTNTLAPSQWGSRPSENTADRSLPVLDNHPFLVCSITVVERLSWTEIEYSGLVHCSLDGHWRLLQGAEHLWVLPRRDQVYSGWLCSGWRTLAIICMCP